MTPARYFGGAANDLGHISALEYDSFAALITSHVATPRQIPVSREEYHAKPKKERDQLKRVGYLTPAAFGSSPSPRKTSEAIGCNLIALDIDDAANGMRLLHQSWIEVMPDFAYVVWQTASSTPTAPRLRVLVSADGIPTARYADAVRSVGEMLGLTEVTSESLVAVQPMYLPTQFVRDEMPVFVHQKLEGDRFTVQDILGGEDMALGGANVAASEAEAMGDLEYLRTPLEGITLEDAAEALTHLDPDCPMQQWIEIAAGLKHQFNTLEAYELWDKWSSKGSKYADSDETKYRWSTLKAQPIDRAPITIRTVFRLATARGWSNPTLTHRIHLSVSAWISNSVRSTEELLDQGMKRIAKAAPVIGTLEKKSLMATLKGVMNGRNITVTLPDIRAEVRKLELDAARTTGVPPWAKGLCFVTSTNRFYRYTVDRKFAPEVIDLMYSTPAIGEEKPQRPRDYLTQIANVPQVEALRYEPAQGAKRFYNDGGVPYCNIYLPSYATPDKDQAEQAGELFSAHIDNLVREPENRKTLLDYLAFHVLHPGCKIRWAVLLQGAQGCGKTFLSVAMGAVLGRRNVRKLAATDVLNGQFNGWAYGQQMIFMEEVRIVGQNRFSIMDRLKPCISDDEISLRELHEPARTVPNISNYVMFTNHHDALAVSDGDRRYFVISSPLQHAVQITALGEDYFAKLFNMVRDQPGGLRAWFEGYTLSPDFDPDGRAPITKYLHELAVTSASPLASAVNQVIIDDLHPLVKCDLLSLGVLRALLRDANIPPFSDQALALVLLEHGWERGVRCSLDGHRHTLWHKGFAGKDLVSTAAGRLDVL